MSVITAGQLDRRVRIERKVITRDQQYRSQVVSWVTLATVWAQVLESSTAASSNPGEGEAVNAYARPTRIRMRYRGDVDTTMRVNLGGRLYQINGTAELGRRDGLELACQEWAHEQ